MQVWMGSDGFDVMIESFPALWKFLRMALPMIEQARRIEND